MIGFDRLLRMLLIAGLALSAGPLQAQVRPRIPKTSGFQNAATQLGSGTRGGFGAATQPGLGSDTAGGFAGGEAADLTPILPQQTLPNATLGTPEFDPYRTGTDPGSGFGSVFGAPFGGNPGGLPQNPGTFSGGFDSQPGSLFPQGFGNGFGQSPLLGQSPAFALPTGTPVKFLQGPRIRHTWIGGADNPRDMDFHDSDISIVTAWPNWFGSGQPLYLIPSFSLHLWDGPQFLPTADLPSKAYSAFLDAGWQSSPEFIVGVELGVRVGVFTDFQTTTTDSIRVLGKGLGRLRLTPTLTAKAGVIYVDRAQIKIIPAGGLFWNPNPHARFELFFPEPKAASYVTTLGNQDIWWYIGGEFGGGSWTVQRLPQPPTQPTAFTDRVDIKDIRIKIGFEFGPAGWIEQGRRIGFIEAGWVLDREVVYVVRPQDSFTLRDSFMVRAGFGY